MKSSLLGILGLGALTMSSFGQGSIILEDSDEDPPNAYVTYGNNVPANGVSGALGTPGGLVSCPSPYWTAGFYWAPGTVSVPTDPTGVADPSTLNPLLTLATGLGSTAQIAGPTVLGVAGAYWASSSYTTAGVPGGGTITLETIAYFGSSYASASYRGHSDAYQLVTSAGAGTPTVLTGLPFSVNVVPEPSVLALSSLGAAALMLARKKKTTDN